MTKRVRSKWSKGERNKLESPFAPFPAEMIDSPAFHALLASGSGSALKVLLLLGAVWARNGGVKHNSNGQLIAVLQVLGHGQPHGRNGAPHAGRTRLP